MNLLVIFFVIAQKSLEEFDNLAKFFDAQFAIYEMNSAKLIQQYFLKLAQRFN